VKVLPALLLLLPVWSCSPDRGGAPRAAATAAPEGEKVPDAPGPDWRHDPPPAALPAIQSRIRLKAGGFIIPGDGLQQVEAEAGDEGILKIRRACEWFSTLPDTEPPEELRHIPAELTAHPVFQKLLKKLASFTRREDGLRTLATAAVELNNAIRQVTKEQPGGMAAALEKGQADPVVWNRLLVALCRASLLPAREVHGLLITPGEPKAKAARRVWIEVLEEGHWLAFDPGFSPAPSDDGDYVLESLLEGGCDAYVPAPVMSLHLTVVRGQPDAEQEKFLNSEPEVLECIVKEGNALDGTEDLNDDNALPPKNWPFEGMKVIRDRKF
jgi:Transglutaminase-like superfamily